MANDPILWDVGRMRHERKFSTWIRSGGQSTFVLALNSLADLETKFSVAPDRLLDSIIDDALAAAVGRLNQFLPDGVSIDISAVDLTPIRDQLRSEVAGRLTEIGVAVNPNDPVITSIIARYAESLNGFFQTEALHVERYTWRSSDDSRVRAAHAEYDDRIFSWSDPPESGHPGQGWNCRCTAEPDIDLASIPEGGVCDILTGDRLASVFPDADSDRLAQIAREIDLQIVAARLDSPDPNRAYADRIGNGGIESGDGWRFRGRGLKQVTGRANYRAFTEDHARMFGDRIDFEAGPELLGTPRHAVRSALWFSLADAGIYRAAADSITAIINPGTDSYGQRWENVRDLNASEVFSNICRFSVAKPRFEDAE